MVWTEAQASRKATAGNGTEQGGQGWGRCRERHRDREGPRAEDRGPGGHGDRRADARGQSIWRKVRRRDGADQEGGAWGEPGSGAEARAGRGHPGDRVLRPGDPTWPGHQAARNLCPLAPTRSPLPAGAWPMTRAAEQRPGGRPHWSLGLSGSRPSAGPAPRLHKTELPWGMLMRCYFCLSWFAYICIPRRTRLHHVNEPLAWGGAGSPLPTGSAGCSRGGALAGRLTWLCVSPILRPPFTPGLG